MDVSPVTHTALPWAPKFHWPEGSSPINQPRSSRWRVYSETSKLNLKGNYLSSTDKLPITKQRHSRILSLMATPTRKLERKGPFRKAVLGSQRSGFEIEGALGEFSLCFLWFGAGAGGGLFYFSSVKSYRSEQDWTLVVKSANCKLFKNPSPDEIIALECRPSIKRSKRPRGPRATAAGWTLKEASVWKCPGSPHM